MLDQFRSLSVAEAYDRLMQRASQAQKQLDEVAAAIPTAPEGTFTYPLPTQEQFARMWPKILTDERLEHYWARRLRAPEASNAKPSQSDSASSPRRVREEAA